MRNRLSLSRALRGGLLTLAAALALSTTRPATAQTAKPSKPLVIKAGRILTVTHGAIENGVLVIRDGKIVAIGKQGEVTLPPDAEILDASGMWVMPGQVDLHTHIGNDSGLHDYVHSLNPAFRVWDYIDPESPQVKDSIASGITTILTIPGSGGNNSGFGVLWKLGGAKREDLIIRKLGAIKIAQAYNPERRAGDLGLSRMGMWWMLREQFDRAKKYDDQWEAYEKSEKSAPHAEHLQLASTAPGGAKVGQILEPKKVLGLEQMRAVMEHKTPVFVHTAGARDVMETMTMFHDERNLPVVISHGEFGGLREASEAAKRGIPCNIGPRLYDFSFQTYDRRFYSIPLEYARAGVQNLSLNTDCPVIPSDDLFVQGTISVRMGMDEDLALRALTINPATAIGIGDRIGSLEVGKDADLIIKRGSLFDPRNPIEKVLINGKIVYTHGQRRKGVTSGPSLPEGIIDDDGCNKDDRPEEGFFSRVRE